jgi:beta-lactamase class A
MSPPILGPSSLSELEATVHGRVGVFALDTGSGREVAHRPDERFAMCSTFKWVLVAAVLVRVDRNELSLADQVSYGPTDLLEHAPVTRAHVAEGSLTVETLAEAAVIVSDNTAANLLLTKVEGPTGLTLFMRTHGDTVTRLDRNEPTLNTNTRGDPRDTTSPRAMVKLMRDFLVGDALSTASRDRLLRWMRATETGKDRLRAGLPQGWPAGDKTGTGERGAVNDVAIAWPPNRQPILVAAYLSDSNAAPGALVKAQENIGRLVAQQF